MFLNVVEASGAMKYFQYLFLILFNCPVIFQKCFKGFYSACLRLQYFEFLRMTDVLVPKTSTKKPKFD